MVLAGRVVLILGYPPNLHARLLRALMRERLAKKLTQPSLEFQHELRVAMINAVVASTLVMVTLKEGKNRLREYPVVLLFALTRHPGLTRIEKEPISGASG